MLFEHVGAQSSVGALQSGNASFRIRRLFKAFAPFLFGRVPVVAVASQFKGKLNLLGAGLGLLQAEDIRVYLKEGLRCSFAERSPDSINIPRE